jgi:hypothetical protein
LILNHNLFGKYFVAEFVDRSNPKMPEKLDYVTTLSPEIIERAEKELGEDEHRRIESVLALREWAKKQPHLQAMPLGNTTHRYLFKFC